MPLDREGYTDEELQKLKVPELKNLCKEKGISPLPTRKAELIQALVDRNESAGAGAAYVPSPRRARGTLDLQLLPGYSCRRCCGRS